eukprot:gene284-8513_t
MNNTEVNKGEGDSFVVARPDLKVTADGQLKVASVRRQNPLLQGDFGISAVTTQVDETEFNTVDTRKVTNQAALAKRKAHLAALKAQEARIPLPAGWTRVDSQSRPGDIVYENMHTGERQAWFPDLPAPEASVMPKVHLGQGDNTSKYANRLLNEMIARRVTKICRDVVKEHKASLKLQRSMEAGGELQDQTRRVKTLKPRRVKSDHATSDARSEYAGTYGSYADLLDQEKMKKMIVSQPAKMAEKMEALASFKDESSINRNLLSNWDMCRIRVSDFISTTLKRFWQWEDLTGMDVTTAEISLKNGRLTAVYFSFLRQMFYFNFAVGCMWLLFVMVPSFALYGAHPGVGGPTASQMMPNPNRNEQLSDYQSVPLGSSRVERMGEENWFQPQALGLLTGGAPLNHSAYFMGAYFTPYSTDNHTANASYGLNDRLVHTFESTGVYSVPNAYLWLGIITPLLYLVWILVGIGSNVTMPQEYTDFDGAAYKMSRLVFTGYDHAVTTPRDRMNNLKANAEDIKEILGETKRREYDLANSSYSALILIRITINIVIFALIGGSSVAIITVVNLYVGSSGFSKLIPSITMAVINGVLPSVFEFLAAYERWGSRLMVIMLTIARSILVKIVTFTMFFQQTFRMRENYACWESLIGRETYTLFVVGSIILDITYEIGVALWAWATSQVCDCSCSDTCTSCSACCTLIGDWWKSVASPDKIHYDVIKKLLQLVYAQAIIWFGFFWCPLLSLVGCIRMFVLFFIQAQSVRRCYDPIGKEDNTILDNPEKIRWLFFVCFGIHWLLATMPFAYMMADLAPSGTATPSNYWYVANLASNEWPNETSVILPTEDNFTNVSVTGWCILGSPELPTCAEVGGVKVFDFLDEEWEYDFSMASACEGNGTNCEKCQELPNYQNCSSSSYPTASCDACLEQSADMDAWVCYSPGYSAETDLFKKTVQDDDAEQASVPNKPHLPHDCGVLVKLEFLCQQCPSGCGPFRNKPFMFATLREGIGHWARGEWFIVLVNFIGSVSFTILLSLVFLAYWMVTKRRLAQERSTGIEALQRYQREAEMERLDKQWVLREYNITFESKAKQASMPATLDKNY